MQDYVVIYTMEGQVILACNSEEEAAEVAQDQSTEVLLAGLDTLTMDVVDVAVLTTG